MTKEINVLVRTDDLDGKAVEYFCKSCLQLRLSFIPNTTHCYNCKSKEIITGKVGTLDKQALLKQHTP